MKESILFLLTLSTLSVCAITDVLYYKVYNMITFPGFIIGFILNMIPFSKDYLISTVIWVLFFYFIAMMGIMGMGDIKLCMCIISLQGINKTVNMILCGCLLLTIYAFFTNKKATINSLKETFHYFTLKKRIDSTNSKYYPFALFLALGYSINFVL